MPDAQTDYLVADNGERVESFGQLVRANKIAAVEKRNRILSLRRKGFTPDQIAEVLARGEDEKAPVEISPSGVLQAINRYVRDLAEEDRESIEAIRLIDNERLEGLWKRLELDVRDSDPVVRVRAVHAQLKVLERHAKLNGLDAPQQHRVTGSVDHNLIADPKRVEEVDASFRRRHGGEVIELPAGDAREVGVGDES